ncbi:DUF2062 domain-containing protein [Pandoraea anhela]|nr:DUF2062 domain-containing protein [Pandoraea anhela]
MLRPMRLLRSRWLRPHAGMLLRRSLWQATPRGVAIGLACGVFFGFLLPVAQMPVAILVAAFLRGNLFLATTGTLITNPLTVPFVYLGAHRLGRWMLDWSPKAEFEATVAAAAHASESFWTQLLHFDFGTATLHLGAGLAAFAVVGGVLAYVIGFFAIHWHQQRRAVTVRHAPSAPPPEVG